MSLCEYINKHDIQCPIKSKAIYNLNDKYYCKKHFDSLSKKEHKKKCEYVTKTNKECITKAKEEYRLNNSYYCKKHFNILNKKIFKEETDESAKEETEEDPEESAKEETDESAKEETEGETEESDKEETTEDPKKSTEDEPKEDPEEETKKPAKAKSKKTKIPMTYCSINKCKKEMSTSYNNLDLCLTHYNKTITNEKKEIMKEVKRLTKVIITEKTKSIIKKDIYKILLIIHPDKCKNPNINSTELTQEINKILEKIKG